MTLPLEVDSLEAVPEALREQYATKPDGGYRLAVEGLPQVDPAAVAMLRKELKQAKAQAAGSSEKHQAALAELDALRAKAAELDAAPKASDAVTQAAVDKVRRELGAEIHRQGEQLKAIQEERDQAKARLRQSAIQSALEQAAMRHHVRGEHVDDLTLPSGLFDVLPDGTVVKLGADGEPERAADGQLVTAEVWLLQQRAAKPGWFLPSTGGGARGSGHQPLGPDGRRAVDPTDTKAFNKYLDQIASGEMRVVPPR